MTDGDQSREGHRLTNNDLGPNGSKHSPYRIGRPMGVCEQPYKNAYCK